MTDRPRNPLALILLVCLTTPLTLWTNSLTGETNCSTSSGAEGVCVMKALRAEATRVAEGMCTEIANDHGLERDARQQCEGKLKERRANPPTPSQPWRPPFWLRASLDISIGATAAAAGACAGVGCPPEVTVGLSVASVGTLVVRLLFEALR